MWYDRLSTFARMHPRASSLTYLFMHTVTA